MKKYAVINVSQTWHLEGVSPYYIILENIQKTNPLNSAYDFSGTSIHCEGLPKPLVHFRRNEILFETDSKQELLEQYFEEFL